MADLDAIRLLHWLCFHGPLGGNWAPEAKAAESYEGLSAAQRAPLAASAQVLGLWSRYKWKSGKRDVPQALLEMACYYQQTTVSDWKVILAKDWLDVAVHILRAYEGLTLDQRTTLARYAGDQGVDLPLEVGGRGDKVLIALSKIGLLDPSGRLQEVYRGFSPEEGQQLVQDTIEIWRSDPETNQEETKAALIFLACLVPGSFRGSHRILLEEYISGLADAAEPFWDVDPEARDQMIRIVETDRATRGWVAHRLALTRDEVVRAIMHRWRHSPPDGDDLFARE